MVKQPQPSSATARGLSLGLLGLRLTGSYLGYQLERLFGSSAQKEKHRNAFRKKASRQVREELARLKGPAMKAGQVLSMATDIVSEDVVREMTELQMHAPPMHSALARAQFKASLGKYPEELFTSFDAQPFAAASLGQVHRATTHKGELVAVKIQYPAIRNTIVNDFKLLRSATFAGQLTGHLPKPVLDEVESGMLGETDYLKEGHSLEFFAKELQPLEYVRVPQVYWPYTSNHVLTMTLMEGQPLHLWLQRNRSAAVRNQLGARLLKLFVFQIHQVRSFHADPHPGNYLFTDDGQINLVDFGCVKELTPDFSRLIESFLERAWLRGGGQYARMLRLLWGEEAATEPEARTIVDLEIELFNIAFPPPEARRRVVDFASPRLFELGLQIRKECLKAKLAKAGFAFYARAELGLYNMLHQLQAKIDTNVLLESVRKQKL